MLVEADIEPHKAYKLTIADFELLAEAGAFEGRRVELIDGRVIVMNAAYRRHYRAHSEFFVRMYQAVRALDCGLSAWVEASVALPPFSEPLPDIVVSMPPQSDKAIELEAVRLIVEVADSTEPYDLKTKALLYAESGVPEYWVLALASNEVRLFWLPEPEGYQAHRVVRLGEPVRAETIPGLTVDTAGLI